MPRYLFANRASSVTASSITDVATSLVIQAGDGIKFSSPAPGEEFRAVLWDAAGNWEIIGCTSRNTDTLSVITRGLEGSTARQWPAGTPISQRVTKAIFDAFQLPAIHSTPVEDADDTPISSGYLFTHVDPTTNPHPQYIKIEDIDDQPTEDADDVPVSSAYLFRTKERYLHIRDQKSAGVAGGSASSGAWRIRTLNYVVENGIDGASLASNVVTLPAGTYLVNLSCPAYRVNGHSCRLYDITNNLVLRGGSTAFSDSDGSYANTRSAINSVITLADETDIRVEHRVESTQNTNGFGRPCNFTTESYTEIFITKVA